ncbi:MAG: DUF1015 domain-containing protein, partial [Peptococcaceae bacterium]|nr:DUF1015 domain-containing protein [Peptococcaceae bacterium]
MASVIPFAGLRYNPAMVGDLADVVTPPYDVIATDAQERYYDRHPNNIIRLEYGKTLPGDNETNNRYTRACSDFDAWINANVLLPEATPAVYFYEQEFTVKGLAKTRSGFLCAVKLEPYDRGVILPHEETMPKHKADRLDLMRACGANFSPVFGLYGDKELQVEQIKERAIAEKQPEVSFIDETGEHHRMWVVTDPAAIAKVQQIMADKQILIADGHHRYETALNYKTERAARDKQEEASYNYIMMALVNLYDPGLVVLPTHRVIRQVEPVSLDRLMKRLEESFTIEEFTLDQQTVTLPELINKLYKRGRLNKGTEHVHAFGLYMPVNRFYLLTLNQGKELSPEILPGKSQVWRNLDVSILQSLVFNQLLGLNDELIAKGELISYVRDEAAAVALVDNGEFDMAFFLNPTLEEEIIRIAGVGEKMPQKSTFFYPKLISG